MLARFVSSPLFSPHSFPLKLKRGLFHFSLQPRNTFYTAASYTHTKPNFPCHVQCATGLGIFKSSFIESYLFLFLLLVLF